MMQKKTFIGKTTDLPSVWSDQFRVVLQELWELLGWTAWARPSRTE